MEILEAFGVSSVTRYEKTSIDVVMTADGGGLGALGSVCTIAMACDSYSGASSTYACFEGVLMVTDLRFGFSL